jgi:hypothetical protein
MGQRKYYGRIHVAGNPLDGTTGAAEVIRLSDCPYAEDIKRAMAAYLPLWPWQYGVAQLYQESLWNPLAVSPAGAEGIAQFMPETWDDMVRKMGFVDTASPFEPMFAIPAFGRYMRDLRRVWSHVDRTEDERRKLTMASYNCGTGNMLKAQKVAQGASGYDRIIAALPQVTGVKNAHETADYVAKIYRWYGELSST